MTAKNPLTQNIVNSITEDVMASVADILFLAKVLSVNNDTGLLEPPKEISNAVRNIENSLSGLTDFTFR